MNSQFEQLPDDQISLPAGIEQDLDIETLSNSSDQNDSVKTNNLFSPPPTLQPAPSPPAPIDLNLSSLYLSSFHANKQVATPKGPAYLIMASFIRNPNFLVGKRIRSAIGINDQMFMAYWCSAPTFGWYSKRMNRFYNRRQTPWLPVIPGKLTHGVAWMPGKGYDPSKHVVTHSMMLMRMRGNQKEVVVWQPANKAPRGFTGHPVLRPKNPADLPNFNMNKTKLEYKISWSNPRGMEIWGGRGYRTRLNR